MIKKLKETVVRIRAKIAGIKFKKPSLTFKVPSLSFKKINLRKAFMQTTGGVVLAGTAVTMGAGTVMGMTAAADSFAVSRDAKACLDATKIGMVCAPEGERALETQRNVLVKMFTAISLVGGGGLIGVGLYSRTLAATPRPKQPKI